MTEEQAIKELYNTAMHINNKDSQGNISIMTEEQKAFGLLAVNGMDETNFVRASEFLFSESEGQMIIDTYKEQMTSQAIFTSTPSQFINNEYTLDSSIRLGDQSYILFPSAKVGETFYNTGKVVGPVVIRQTGQVYDDIGRQVYIRQQEIPIIRHFGPDEINDIVNESMPATTGLGAGWNIGKGIYDNQEQIKEAVKNIFNIDTDTSGN